MLGKHGSLCSALLWLEDKATLYAERTLTSPRFHPYRPGVGTRYLAEGRGEAGLVVLQHLLLQRDLTERLLRRHELPAQVRVLRLELLQAPLAATRNKISHTVCLGATHAHTHTHTSADYLYKQKAFHGDSSALRKMGG